MPKIEVTRKNRHLSLSLEVARYITYLAKNKKNASQHVDDAVKATEGFKKFKKELKNE